MAADMQNIDMRDFTTVGSVESYDHVVLTLFDGSAAKMTVSLLSSVLTRGIVPSIGEDGVWKVGDTSTGVTAEGRTPEFRKGLTGIEYKYTTEGSSMWRILVDYADLRMRYEDLTEEQVQSIKLNFDDLTEEDIAELQAPANEMIAKLEATDKAVNEAETVRIAAEEERIRAEQERLDAEELRDSAEQERKSAEDERKTNELERIGNEQNRQTNEDLRKAAENTRVSSENARAQAETSRVEVERERVEAENVRELNEQTRQRNEQIRENNEAVRKNAETFRTTNEDARQSNEAVRERNESDRISQEESRVKAESERAEDYAALRKNIVEATENANNAAEESRNTPIIQSGTWWIWSVEQDAYVDTGSPATSRSPQIQNGTWWTWDDANGVYVDTGKSVNADYVLTKEKIEGVFQGNIETHWHDRYVDKEEGKGLSTEDFTTEEKVKLSGLQNYDDANLIEAVNRLRSELETWDWEEF